MDISTAIPIAAVIAAAGFSRRMGHFKQLLPWGSSTVIRTVVDNLHEAGAAPVVCVTGYRSDDVTNALTDSPAQVIHNPRYTSSEMLTSYQAGIRALNGLDIGGTLLALADQPHIRPVLIRQVIEQAQATPDHIVIPSHAMRRGHPIYLPRRLWADLLSLPVDSSLRQLLNQHAEEIVYVDVDTDGIRRDMDEWGEYETLRGEFEACRDGIGET